MQPGLPKAAQACSVVEFPPNAYLDCFRDQWNCDRGFRKSGNACVVLDPPPNTFIDRSGSDRECNHGYRRDLVSRARTRHDDHSLARSSRTPRSTTGCFAEDDGMRVALEDRAYTGGEVIAAIVGPVPPLPRVILGLSNPRLQA